MGVAVLVNGTKLPTGEAVLHTGSKTYISYFKRQFRYMLELWDLKHIGWVGGVRKVSTAAAEVLRCDVAL